VWSLGVLLYSLCFSQFPFEFEEEQLEAMFQTRSHPMVTFPRSSQVSEDLKDLLHCMLEVNAEDRISMEEIILHPWFEVFEENDS